ncbi:MAG: S-methyl-5'-thioinosine phosphorylase [Gammaproteobacteria bacterium]|nr:S-methyl-5'-thioinosine phosphorylase [Gammaproteobacteria bacterium]MDH3448290.1 S-methyl-5'-thioinosine phosphorylase [Gammaproteobacteria bacterium]
MLAIIGGSGLYSLGEDFELQEQLSRETPYGDTSADILQGRWHGIELVFLPRHGPGHKVPPHRINYRANLWALGHAGVTRIIAVNAVGGISADMPPLTLALPDQIIDYSSGREQTYFDGDDAPVTHIDFSWPYSAKLRAIILEAGLQQGQSLVDSGTYGNSNGPRLETAAEIARMRRDGCTMVGMTGMPEAALARELDIEYACLALVVNWAAGIENRTISMQDIIANMEQGMLRITAVLLAAARKIVQ